MKVFVGFLRRIVTFDNIPERKNPSAARIVQHQEKNRRNRSIGVAIVKKRIARTEWRKKR